MLAAECIKLYLYICIYFNHYNLSRDQSSIIFSASSARNSSRNIFLLLSCVYPPHLFWVWLTITKNVLSIVWCAAALLTSCLTGNEIIDNLQSNVDKYRLCKKCWSRFHHFYAFQVWLGGCTPLGFHYFPDNLQPPWDKERGRLFCIQLDSSSKVPHHLTR